MMVVLLLCVAQAAPLPEETDCFTVNGRDYRGSVSRAGPEATPCLYWNQTLLHRYNSRADPSGALGLGEHNHCRNPDGDVQPWCYVSETEEGVYWKYCDIPSCHMPGYVGCFLDPGSPPALSGDSGTSTKLTIQTCIHYCRSRGAQYAGLEAGYACFCGGERDAAALQEVSGEQCDQACFGRSSELCGGDGKLSVYGVWVGSCGGNLSAPSGVLYSPGYPDEYSTGSACSWEVRPPGSVAVELRIRSFLVEDPSDVLEVRDGASGELLALIPGGQDPPRVVTFSRGHLSLTFRSDQDWSGAGFVLTYTGLGEAVSPDVPMDLDFGTPATPHTEPPYCWNTWLLLGLVLMLLALTLVLFLWRRAPRPGTEAGTPSCPALYKCRDGQQGHLASVGQSSMKSLL